MSVKRASRLVTGFMAVAALGSLVSGCAYNRGIDRDLGDAAVPAAIGAGIGCAVSGCKKGPVAGGAAIGGLLGILGREMQRERSARPPEDYYPDDSYVAPRRARIGGVTNCIQKRVPATDEYGNQLYSIRTGRAIYDWQEYCP